ncbi:hypothetical protein DYU05_15470 [Mucilaginibacter terrenus]|uniref:DUF1569 domain-containing protein n=1 Tax=Mucilaginibacter terrenus TaxID=2482727 RepID=A0A3E2NM27_9SPHI|nr:hypothetical protein [Mucilaginibacter terrenus]RFZ82028.1 hypothetical protein DYU05_15470 [Mucilaginibacter terrenus]
MFPCVNIADYAQVSALLNCLTADCKPQWGKMTSQQMVEHLIDQLEYTNGRKTPTLDVPEADAAVAKQQWIFTPLRIPKGLVLVPSLGEYFYADLAAAKKQLLTELTDFHHHFSTPGITEIHGGFGAMNYAEWINWHSKHFTHHFAQFGLVNDED